MSLAIIVFAGCIVLEARDLRHAWVLSVLLFPLQTPMRLHQIVKKPENSAGLLPFTELAPIRSEHWGETSRNG